MEVQKKRCLFSCLKYFSNAHVAHVLFVLFKSIISVSIFLGFFSDKVMVAGQQTALGISIMDTVNMAPVSPKTS